MELEPITRQEQIIAGKDLEPITRMEKFLKQYGGGGGGGFEYDFIIREALDATEENIICTLEKGTYASIMSKLGTMPLNGKLLVNLGDDAQKSDFSAVIVEYVGNKLQVYIVEATNTSTLTPTIFVINDDNTVTFVE